MRGFTSMLSATLFVSNVFAASPMKQRKDRFTRQSPLVIYNTQPLQSSGTAKFGTAGGGSVTDPNWAGALQLSQNITAVSGSVTFPEVSIPAGGSNSTEYLGSAWVGIDGDTCGNAIWQAGIYWILQGAQTSLFAFYEWYPEPVQVIKMSATPGDVFSVSIVATSSTSGTVLVENQSTGETFNTKLTGQEALCQKNAEWILEDNEELPFAQFSDVTFSDISWTAAGQSSGLSGATLLNIEQSGKMRTSCNLGDGEVTCSYIA